MLFNFILCAAITVFGIVPLQASQISEEFEQKNQDAQREISPEEQTQLNQELAALLDRDGFAVSFKQALDLVERGADINTQSANNGLTLLGAAIHDENMVKKIINKGAHVNGKALLDDTPLALAIYYKNSKVVKVLLDKGALVNQLDASGATPLHNTTSQLYFPWINPTESKEIVKMLLDYGADPFVKFRGKTAREIAQNNAKFYIFWPKHYRLVQAIIKMLKDQEKYYMEVFEISHPVKKMKLPQKAVEARLKLKGKLATHGEAAFDLGEMISEHLPSPKIKPGRYTLTTQEWDELAKLTQGADARTLSLDDEERFEQLVETIDREIDEARAYATPEKKDLLNSALRQWDLLRARKLID